MKKQFITALVTILPAVSFAKVADFNALISDNMTAQTELHTTVRKNVQVANSQKNIKEKIVIVDNTKSSYTAPSRRDLLRFKKEMQHNDVSQSKQFERVANEMNSAE
jgi:hypothetical protein